MGESMFSQTDKAYWEQSPQLYKLEIQFEVSTTGGMRGYNATLKSFMYPADIEIRVRYGNGYEVPTAYIECSEVIPADSGYHQKAKEVFETLGYKTISDPYMG